MNSGKSTVPEAKTPSEIPEPQRIERVKSLLADTFRTAVAEVGLQQALVEWNAAPAATRRKRGRPRKAGLSRKDWWLLVFYDVAISDLKELRLSRETIPRFLGWLLAEEAPRHTHSAKATEKQLRRLLRQRAMGEIYPHPLWPNYDAALEWLKASGGLTDQRKS
jgi:hypothetical protein